MTRPLTPSPGELRSSSDTRDRGRADSALPRSIPAALILIDSAIGALRTDAAADPHASIRCVGEGEPVRDRTPAPPMSWLSERQSSSVLRARLEIPIHRAETLRGQRRGKTARAERPSPLRLRLGQIAGPVSRRKGVRTPPSPLEGDRRIRPETGPPCAFSSIQDVTDTLI